MVIKNPDAAEYIEPLKKLFPQGEYWDKLLSDEASDISLVCKVRAENLAEFKARMNQLQRETFLDFADETIDDWERIYFGYKNDDLELEKRRSLLRAQKFGGINISILKTIAETYGGSVSKWEIPYMPAAFAHARFGLTYMSSIAGMWVVFVHCSVPETNRTGFETAVRRVMLANQTIFFVYGD
ncbi:MAG: DUF2313 domain-containing protein [Treponema sp.]|nr:DUF2313 domain-containing protein [Treponema sp.]